MDARWLMSLSLLGAGEAARAGAGSDAAPVAALSKLGARVERDPTAPDKPVIAVDLSSTRVTDAGLERLEGLGGLETLYLVSTNVTDAGLVHLKGLAHLTGVSLSETEVTDRGIADLEKTVANVRITR
jgi:hypothetical protein